ncbi:MDR family MFS transporter [Saccharibacillus sp. CPCC 101409]|uniref:MDR family MFS transporter n=1 Tax=Saccharibacillus sp. CPCC 101409 TaxID=3058041 RepID=UPI002671D947|nr:MDR family MFS transporter [Saccharibacillus sp. CPCC 101409]MDO3412639.1 MDR family MFS transporter [Saccharibacillus sp. CPCC 101409]
MLSTFLAAVEGTVISPATPSIVAEFQAASLMSWVFAAYLLTMAVTTPIFGKLSDLFGRKPIFLIGCVLFIFGSMLCGFAGGMEQLIAFRAIQGIGAGAVIPVTYTIVGDLYKIEERGKVQGMISSVWGIASLVGPLLGGYLVDTFSWRWIFGINVPFGLLAVLFIALFLREERTRRKARIDWAGAATFTIGMTALLLALTSGGDSAAWNSPLIIGLLAGAALLLAAFVAIEQKAAEPLVPLRLFRIRDITFVSLAAIFVSTLLIGLTTYIPLWIQGVLGGSAVLSGLLLAPMSFSWIAGSFVGGRMVAKSGARGASVIGLLALVAGIAGVTLLDRDSSNLILPLLMLVLGVGFGMSLTVFTIVAQSSVGYSLRGASTALNTFLRTLGQTLGVAFFGTWLNASLLRGTERLAGEGITGNDINALLSEQTRQTLPAEKIGSLSGLLEGGLHSLFIIMLILTALGLLAVLPLSKRPPAPREERSEETPAAN